MKHIKVLFLSLMSLVLFTACPGPDPEPESEPQTFMQSLQIPSEKGQQTYTANDLRTGISDVQSTSSWLTVTPMAYGSGAPKVQLTYEENSGGERSAVVKLTDVNGNKVLLTITQVKKGDIPVNPDPSIDPNPNPDPNSDSNYGIDDTHDVVTDKPANSRDF